MSEERTHSGSVVVPLTKKAGAPGNGMDSTLPPRPEPPAPRPRFGHGQIAGVVATGAIHVILILALVIANKSQARSKARPPKEMIIQTQILEVQAGSREGTRTAGPAFKRRGKKRIRRSRSKKKRLVFGRRARRGPRARRAMSAPVDDGKDDAANAPADFGSSKGVDAPPGARPSDDKHGAGGTADKGALDPCFTQHAQVVAGYRTKVARAIPRMKRPAFVSAAVAENLATGVRVAVNASGSIVRVSVARPSGNPRFDGAAVAHVKTVSSFPAPHKCVMYDKKRGRFRNAITFGVTVRAR